jgi:hypothetical protein
VQDKNVLVNGCSFSRGPIAWPYCLQKKLNFNLVNLSLSSAGNKYIHDSTIAELSQRQYDHVFIMWTGLQRNDVQVADIAQFDQCVTSAKQVVENDWDDKVVWPVNDRDYVEKDWVFIGLDNPYIKLIKFAEYIKYRSRANEVHQSLLYMITLQAVLKAQGIPYTFSFFTDYVTDLTHSPLYTMLDFNNICAADNIHAIAKRINSHDVDGYHPGVEANQLWADKLIEFINAKTK